VLEYARDVLGYTDADNAEVNPNAEMPVIAPLRCALSEESRAIEFLAGSYIANLYRAHNVTEKYHCSYGVSPRYVPIFDGSDLFISGVDPQAEPRAIELKNHPFFIGTAYQPERSALTNENHPLIAAFVQAAAGRLVLCASQRA